MGFSREIAIEALMNASSVEQAAEYCVSMPMRNLRTTPLAANFTPFGTLDEEEQIQQAIALSLSGELVVHFLYPGNQKSISVHLFMRFL